MRSAIQQQLFNNHPTLTHFEHNLWYKLPTRYEQMKLRKYVPRLKHFIIQQMHKYIIRRYS